MRHVARLLLAALFVFAGVPAHAAPADGHGTYAVIVNLGVPVTDVTMSDVTRLLLGERQFWRSDLQVVILLPPSGTPTRQFLLEQVFHMNEATFRRHMLTLLYRGELDYAPKTVNSVDELFTFTAGSPGAITIVPMSLTLPSTVRILTVDGRKPGSPGYALSH